VVWVLVREVEIICSEVAGFMKRFFEGNIGIMR